MAQHARTRGREAADGPLSGAAVVEQAKTHLLDLAGRECESVSGLTRTHDGWDVMLEVVELERVPQTTDILASYLLRLDERGDLLGYERVARYYRNQAGGE